MSHAFAFLRVALVAAIGLSCVCNSVRGDANTGIVYKICSGKKFGPFDYFDDCRDGLIRDIENNVPNQIGYTYYSTNPGFPGLCYGHAACNNALTQIDCRHCVEECEIILDDSCYWSFGYQIQLADCRLRIENYSFKED